VIWLVRCDWSVVEIHATNETCTYLMKLVHEIGLELRSSAVCTALRRLRYGHFTLSHALLTKHCDARSLAENIEFCRPTVTTTLAEQRSDTVRQRDSDQALLLDHCRVTRTDHSDESLDPSSDDTVDIIDQQHYLLD